MILIMKYFFWADLLFKKMLLVRRKSLCLWCAFNVCSVFFCIVITHLLLCFFLYRFAGYRQPKQPIPPPGDSAFFWTMCRNFSYYNGPTFNEPFNTFIASSFTVSSSHSCTLKCCLTIPFHFLLILYCNNRWYYTTGPILIATIPASDSLGLIRSVVPIAWLCSVDMQSPDLISTYT